MKVNNHNDYGYGTLYGKGSNCSTSAIMFVLYIVRISLFHNDYRYGTLYGKGTDCSTSAIMFVLYIVRISLFSMKCWSKAKVPHVSKEPYMLLHAVINKGNFQLQVSLREEF